MNTEPSAGDTLVAIFLIALVGLAIGGLAWFIVDIIQDQQERSVILDQCWECGWGKVIWVDDGYRCYGWEGSAESVRTLEWVQENACQ